jgi:DNA-binding FrmR family transcriptional regulator
VTANTLENPLHRIRGEKGGVMLKPSEREKLQDVLLLIQSVRNILTSIRKEVISDLDDIQQCFSTADRKITHLLRT